MAVVRVSGPRALAAVQNLAGAGVAERRAALRTLRRADGTHLDTAVVLVFPEGQSFTGETVAEFQVHGSIAVVNALLFSADRRPGAFHWFVSLRPQSWNVHVFVRL